MLTETDPNGLSCCSFGEEIHKPELRYYQCTGRFR
jgi:hypothetical protein